MENGELIPWKLPVQQESIIKVIGVGGGGSNAVNHMCRQGIHGVEFVVCNTDIQALRQSPVKNRIQLGKVLTEGRGAGCVPERGRKSAVESMDFIRSMLAHQTKMVFITAGMGGGTGTGAAPEIARQARELGILTIGIVTLPFSFEGRRKMEQAMQGIDELEEVVDALLIVENDRLPEIYGDLRLSEAFAKADDILAIAAKSIAEIITIKGYINVDFADVNSVMRESGVALMGAGEAEGEERATQALEDALVSPLLSSCDIRGASKILLNMLYGEDALTTKELKLINERLKERVGKDDADIIWGTGQDHSLGKKLRVAVIAVGFNGKTEPLAAPGTVRKHTVAGTAGQPVEFKVEDLPEELEMITLRSAELEEEARARRQKQQEQKTRLYPEESPRRRRNGANDMPDSSGWLRQKLGGMFSDDTNRDAEMK
ncbi:MAG: cell division protein FtsZ [Culturomica sp.]|jgi:cell division protein FtsZ|nr:cell division protein FtsZ [Culturomica sp.]